MTTEKVYELIEKLRNYRDGKEKDILYSKKSLVNLLLAALGELGYTVPADIPTDVFKCGMCTADYRSGRWAGKEVDVSGAVTAEAIDKAMLIIIDESLEEDEWYLKSEIRPTLSNDSKFLMMSTPSPYGEQDTRVELSEDICDVCGKPVSSVYINMTPYVTVSGHKRCIKRVWT